LNDHKVIRYQKLCSTIRSEIQDGHHRLIISTYFIEIYQILIYDNLYKKIKRLYQTFSMELYLELLYTDNQRIITTVIAIKTLIIYNTH
jgi:hypothetical protein